MMCRGMRGFLEVAATLVLLVYVGPTSGGNILAVLPFPVYSHTVPFVPVLKEMARRGHSLTVISPFPQQGMPPGIVQIDMNFTVPLLHQEMEEAGMPLGPPRDYSGFWYEAAGQWKLCPVMAWVYTRRAAPLLPSPKEHKFDLILTESFFCQEPLAALGHIYNAPVVAKHPGPLMPTIAYAAGNPASASYVPHIRLPYTEKMNLLQRTWNFLVTITDELVYNNYVLPKMDKTMREFFKEYAGSLPDVSELLTDTALLLIETHYSFNYVRPFAKNVLEIGGVGTKLAQPVPKELEDYINESKSGVIYFSYGSQFHSDEMNETLAAFMDTFARLKQRVLFKWRHDIPNRPANVLIRKWFPQNDLLSHEKVLAYISHGGLNSIHEATYHGIPVVGTPLFVDQPHNIRLLEYRGMAEFVRFEDITDGHSLYDAINKVISDPSYRENAQRRSKLLRDRPLPVLDEISYWLEYVMRHGGRHLRPEGANLPWYSRYHLDAISLLLAALLVCLSPLFLLLRRTRVRVTPSKKKTD